MFFSSDEVNQILGIINWNNLDQDELNFKGVSIDSRTSFADDLFVAIEGNNFDGHDFLGEVFNKNVKAVVICKRYKNLVPKNCAYWAVSDTLSAFHKLVLLRRRKLNIPVIGITGSVGKTTTKEMMKEVLKSYGEIKISEKNFNNEIGVGLTINSCKEKDKVLVLEMGMRGRGQIEMLSKCSEPTLAVITNIGSSHIGLLGSKDDIAKAKLEITKYLNPNGTLIIPYECNYLESNLKNFWSGKVIRVKLLNISQENLITNISKDIIIGFYDNYTNSIKVENKLFEINLRGKHNASNFLFAYAVAKELEINFKKYTKFNFKIIEGRNKVIFTKKITLLDETYNASPESIKACIDLLLQYPGKHYFVFGSIKELGEYSLKFHCELIDYIIKKNIDGLVFLCESDFEVQIKNNCILSENIKFLNDINEISKIINSWTESGDCLLIKGSRYWGLERLIPLIN
tara:strand:+ start:369 stop:1742 length:1374 start_codon:yes stop_codon:yes gene_type:complete